MYMCIVGLHYKFFFSYKNRSYLLYTILQFALYVYLYIMYFSGHSLISFKSNMAFSIILIGCIAFSVILMYQKLSRFLFVDVFVVF